LCLYCPILVFGKNKSNCILLFLFLNKMNGIKFIVPFVFLIDQNVLVFMVWVQPQFHHCFTYFFLRLRLPSVAWNYREKSKKPIEFTLPSLIDHYFTTHAYFFLALERARSSWMSNVFFSEEKNLPS
jgi:hypothetical protein